MVEASEHSSTTRGEIIERYMIELIEELLRDQLEKK